MKKTILFLLLFCSMTISASPSFIQSNHKHYETESTANLSFLLNVTSGSLLFCAVQGYATVPCNITDNNNNSWFLYDSALVNTIGMRIFVAVSSNTGVETVTIKSTTTQNIGNVIIGEYSDAIVTKSILKTRLTLANTGTDGIVMGSLAGLTNNVICSFLYDWNRYINCVAGTGFTMRDNTGWDNNWYFEDYTFTDNIEKSITYTTIASNKNFAGISFVLSPKNLNIDSLVFVIKNNNSVNLQYEKILDTDNDQVVRNYIISSNSGYSFLKWHSRNGNTLISNPYDTLSDFYLCGSDTIDVYTVSNPNKNPWPLEVLTWDVDKAYPGIEYNFRLGVKGGEYPYTFTLQHGPTGMTINRTTGEILWTPASATLDSVRVKITDSKGDSLIHRYNIEATTSSFYFVDSATGSNSNDGSEAHPWLTMTYASATADSVSYVYVKKGTYSENFLILNYNCGRFIAYPGDSVVIIGPASGNSVIGISKGSKRIFQGFTLDGNGRRWLFSIGSNGYTKNLIFRKNTMHNIYDNVNENPAGIFFWGGSNNPIIGKEGYKNIVIQDNLFYNIRSTGKIGSSVTCFDVQDLLYENNEAYDIEGRGVNDKDMGYMNTIRNNVIHDCVIGVGLMSQGGESGIDVSYNHIYSCTTTVQFSSVNYLKDVYCYHNTALGKFSFAGPLKDTNSKNINIYKNIIGNGLRYTYTVTPDQVYDTIFRNDSTIVEYHYEWPPYFQSIDTKKVQIDSNIIWSTLDTKYIAGNSWGIPAFDYKTWQSYGYDLNSICMLTLTLDSDSIPILPDSLKYEYGYLIPSGMHPAVITVQPQSNTVKSGETATFSVTATGTGLTYQWYGNNALIPGATSSTYSFTAAKIYNGTRVWCLLTTDTTISTDTAILTVTDMTIDQTTDSLILNIPSDPLFTGQQWYEHDTVITGATALRFVVEADSAAYAKKNYYYCKVWNSVSDTIQSGTWQLGLQPSGTKQKRWFGFKAGAFIGAWR